MASSHNGNEYGRLKDELRRLKRKGAPWYFESELHQRLHGREGGRHRLRPIGISPVLAVAFLTFCILGIALYAVFMNSNIRFGSSPASDSTAAASGLRAPDSVGARPVPAPPARLRPQAAAERTVPPVRTRAADTLEHPLRTVRTPRDSIRVRQQDSSGARKDSVPRAPDTTRAGGGG